jgi:hypothetical protein
MTDIIGNNAAIMASCGALPPLSTPHSDDQADYAHTDIGSDVSTSFPHNSLSINNSLMLHFASHENNSVEGQSLPWVDTEHSQHSHNHSANHSNGWRPSSESKHKSMLTGNRSTPSNFNGTGTGTNIGTSSTNGPPDSMLRSMLRPQSPSHVYDRRTLDLGHFSHPRVSEIPSRAQTAGSRQRPASGARTGTGAGVREGAEGGLEQMILRESKMTAKEFEKLMVNHFGPVPIAPAGAAVMKRKAADSSKSITSGSTYSANSANSGTPPGPGAPPTPSPLASSALASLRRLDLYGSSLSRQMAGLLSAYLASGTCIEDLCLGRNKLTEGVLVPLLRGLISGGGHRFLEKLDLKDNTEVVVNSPVLWPLILQLSELQFLDVSGNRFDALQEQRKSSSGSGSGSGIGSSDSNGSIFRKGLQTQLRSLQVLSMACIAMGDRGAKAVLEGCAGHPSLRVLDLANCLITAAASEVTILGFLKTPHALFPARYNVGYSNGGGNIADHFVLMLHGMIWSGSMVETQPGSNSNSNSKSLQNANNAASPGSEIGGAFGKHSTSISGGARERLVAAAADNHVHIVFDGLYEGIDLTM